MDDTPDPDVGGGRTGPSRPHPRRARHHVAELADPEQEPQTWVAGGDGGGTGIVQTRPMAADLIVLPRWVIPGGELRERFSRSSGPGGQGVNTADSRVELSFDVARSSTVPTDLRDRVLERLATRVVDGVLTIAASEHRAQLSNREAARRRLATVLRMAAAPPPRARRPTRPTRGSQERRISAKKRRGDVKRGRGRGPAPDG